jgi:hypothetical protein
MKSMIVAAALCGLFGASVATASEPLAPASPVQIENVWWRGGGYGYGYRPYRWGGYRPYYGGYGYGFGYRPYRAYYGGMGGYGGYGGGYYPNNGFYAGYGWY